jgi:TonB family protein
MSTMTTRSPSAFALSAALHAAAAALVLGGAWLAQKNVPPPPHIFIPVYGDGDDYTSTVAPRGNPDAGGAEIPKPPKPLPPTARQDPTPSPPTPAQQRSTTTPTRPTTAPSRQTTAPVPNQMTKTEFDRLNNSRSTQPSRQSSAQTQPSQRANSPRIDTSKILGSANSTSTRGAGGTALSRAESDALSAYLSFLVQQLTDAHRSLKPPGLSDRLRARVEFRVNADGSITGVHVIESSGNTAFDQSAVAAFRQIRLPPPPGGRPITDSVLFRMKDEG